MKKILIITLLLNTFMLCLSSDWDQIIETRRTVMLKIFTTSREQNPLTEPIKEFVGQYFFGKTWRHFRYPILKPQTGLSEEEAIARNTLVGQLEKESLDVERYDVYGFLIKNSHLTRVIGSDKS